MKINFQESFELIKSKQPGLSLFQFEKYWQWYLELNQLKFPYHSENLLFNQWLQLCVSGKPIAHILGQWGFFKDLFFVNNTTLIPRPETELMVEAALKLIDRPMHVLEIGVGSGAVILSVMLHSQFKLKCTATDISNEALQLCQKNYDAKYLRLNGQELNLICTDRTFGLASEAYDLILCNPPYIPQDHPGVCKQVQQFEPALALYLTHTEYDQWMKDLLDGIMKCLKPKGVALIEGHEEKLHELKQMAQGCGASATISSATIINDLNQLPRFLRLEK